MKYLYSLSGNDLVLEFPILPNAVFHKGDPIVIDYSTSPFAVKKGVGENFIGIAAEDHSGDVDDFNPRASGDKLKVLCPPDGVYELKAPKYTVFGDDECTATTIHAKGSEFETIPKLFLMLIKKGEGSTNTDEIGQMRAVSGREVDYDHTDSYYFDVSSGGIACDGDEYALIGGIGCPNFSLASDCETYTTYEIQLHLINLKIDSSKVDGSGAVPTLHLKLRNGPLSHMN